MTMAALAKSLASYLQYRARNSIDMLPIQYVASSIARDENQGPDDQGEEFVGQAVCSKESLKNRVVRRDHVGNKYLSLMRFVLCLRVQHV